MLPTRAIVSLARARATVSAVSTSRRSMVHAAARANPSTWRSRPSDLVPRRWNTSSSSSSSSSSSFQSNYDQQQQLAPLGRALVATTKTLKSLLIFSTSTIGLGFFVWSGAHLYLEQYKCPTPPNLSSRVQSLLHGAWVREEYAMDPDVAQDYYKNAVDFATEEVAQALGLRLVGYPSASQQLYSNQQPPSSSSPSPPPPPQQQQQQQSQTSPRDPRIDQLEMDAALVEVHHRRARFLDAIGRDDQAARIWDRLWRMTDAAEAQSSDPATAATLKRPLMVRASGLLFARRAAECWMRLGRYDEAEEALAWALETAVTMEAAAAQNPQNGQQQEHHHHHPLGKGFSVDTQSDEIGLLTVLGALYARKRRFDDALSLFVRALQLTRQRKEEVVEQEPAKDTTATSKETPVSNPRDKWHCREAILMNSIGETLYGAATSEGSSKATAKEKASGKKQEESKKSSGGFGSYFWSSSSKDTPADEKESESEHRSDMILNDKEQEALGWMQKALVLAQEKSGKERDCDECAALVLNNLGMIYEMKGDKTLALEQFKNAVVHATTAQDYVGLESYMENVARLRDEAAENESASLP
ncbi:hypothetical protein DFQ27_007393 [Actinomortierella ambigua]|uniref:Uncharacterized protein n=1 Tax=Actinomortierella ambigua TaxID=1343610 RepID=A0A9P6UBY2_9FUNG|nr:hypothetical protein DFQ27_007393 [Actinomortierella ambigua]